ncbi:hypothetical protein [Hydrogenimonas sp.]
MVRADAGVAYDGLYVGYAYRYDTILRANEGFVTGFYNLKNHIKSDTPQTYAIDIGLEGVEKHALVVAKSYRLYDSADYTVTLGAGGYLSYDTAAQDGKATGNGTIFPDSTYSLAGHADYYFTKNYLYDGWEPEASNGWGYGFHLGFEMESKKYRTQLHLVVNDLFARSRWNDLPTSLVDVETNNSHIGDDGYVEYDPTISGWEILTDHSVKITPKYHIDIQKSIGTYILEGGYEHIDFIHMPYASVAKAFDFGTLKLTYEFRFDSVGLEFNRETFGLSIFSNDLSAPSALGIGCHFRFVY